MIDAAPGTQGQTIWIVRHGERRDVVDPGWIASADRPHDPPLSSRGVEQAEQLAQRLRDEPIDHIIASPFLRTLQTAAPVARVLGLPVLVEHGACEHLNPEWGYDPREMCVLRLAAAFREIDTKYQPVVEPIYPENWDLCRERGMLTSRRLLRRFPGKNLLLVGHAASVSAMTWGIVAGYPQLTGRLAGLVCARHDGTTWRLLLNGDTSHLTDGGYDPQRPSPSNAARATAEKES